MSDEIRQDAENTLSNDDLGGVTGGTAAPKQMAVAAGASAASKGGTNPLHSAVTAQPTTELGEADLEDVAGGKASVHDLNFVKKVDKSSPDLF